MQSLLALVTVLSLSSTGRTTEAPAVVEWLHAERARVFQAEHFRKAQIDRVNAMNAEFHRLDRRMQELDKRMRELNKLHRESVEEFKKIQELPPKKK